MIARQNFDVHDLLGEPWFGEPWLFRKILLIKGHQNFFQCNSRNLMDRMKWIKIGKTTIFIKIDLYLNSLIHSLIIFILENKTIEYPMFCCLCYSSEQEPLKRKNTRGQNVNLDDYDQARVILYPVQSWENRRSEEKWTVILCDMACSG